MLEYAILKPDGILVLEPDAALSQDDFAGLAELADAYLAHHDRLHGVLIHARTFPGWESFAGFIAHVRFVRDHQRQIERVALVTDSHLAGFAEALAKHFTAAEIRHFPFADYEPALQWLKS
jgi:hypothetical protein